jgi:indole-3-glycerol phosphate synthase
MSVDLLTTIAAAARRAADDRQAAQGADVERRATTRRPRGEAFVASLKAPGIRVIAECKRRSPSRGILRDDYDPPTIARGYERAGAAGISVLTEPTFFDGALEHLTAVREAVATPVLRKDFIVTEFQLVEAVAAGADAALLIVAAVHDRTLRTLIARAKSLGLAALVEVHDNTELERALSCGATIVGVNSRNLRTLEVSGVLLDTLAPILPASIVAVAESGLKSSADLRRLKALRYDAFLMGERLMTEADPGAALAALLAAAAGAPA